MEEKYCCNCRHYYNDSYSMVPECLRLVGKDVEYFDLVRGHYTVPGEPKLCHFERLQDGACGVVGKHFEAPIAKTPWYKRIFNK